MLRPWQWWKILVKERLRSEQTYLLVNDKYEELPPDQKKKTFIYCSDVEYFGVGLIKEIIVSKKKEGKHCRVYAPHIWWDVLCHKISICIESTSLPVMMWCLCHKISKGMKSTSFISTFIFLLCNYSMVVSQRNGYFWQSHYLPQWLAFFVCS